MAFGKKRTSEAGAATRNRSSAVEDVLAAMSMADSDGASVKLGESIPDPARHQREKSKMHEVEMDENNVVKHTRRDSTAVGVTPSDPSAIVDLFHEVESIGSVCVPEGSETGSTTGEGEESSEHLAPPIYQPSILTSAKGQISGSNTSSAVARHSGSSLGSTSAAAHPAGSAPAGASGSGSGSGSGSSGAVPTVASTAEAARKEQHHGTGVAHKVFGHGQSSATPPPSYSVVGARTTVASGDGSHPSRDGTPLPYWSAAVAVPAEVAVSAGGGGAAIVLGDMGEEEAAEKGKNGHSAEADRRRLAGFGAVQRTEGAWKLTAEESQQSAQQSTQQGVRRRESARQEQAPAQPQMDMVPPPPALASTVSASEGDVSLSQAPLRRKTSMGSFQKGMGESLTGRLRKQLDIPPEPKREVNLNLPIDQIQCLKYLAQGAMCVAYTALLNGKPVVLKTPLPDTKHAEVAANDLEVEMLLLKELHHDNIVSLLGAGFLPDGRRFVALEYLSGGTLSSVLRNRGSKQLGISKVLDHSLALCNALEYLHDVAVPGRIVCHRDLKPDNIGFSADGTLKLIDFGLGKIIKRRFRVRAEKYQMTGGTGSLRYMAPEIADHQEYNEKGDVYSFSLIMWEMLAAEKPFLGLKRPDFYNRVVDKGERPPLDPEWPLQVRNLLESCWRTNLDERLSFREVGGILKVCAEEENQRCFTEEKRKSVRLPSRRSRLWTTTGARPDLEEISADPQYKPKFKISSFFSHHNNAGGVQHAVGKSAGRLPGAKSKKGVRRVTSNNS